ncbi:MAG: hypothetical protein ACYCTB_07430 [bacterium]
MVRFPLKNYFLKPATVYIGMNGKSNCSRLKALFRLQFKNIKRNTKTKAIAKIKDNRPFLLVASCCF